MAFEPPVAFDCQSIQGKLDQHFKKALIATNKQKRNAIVDFLTSRQNKEGVKMIQDDTTNEFGQKIKVRLRTPAKMCYSFCNGTITCGASTTAMQTGLYEHVYELPDTKFYFCDGGGLPITHSWDFNQWKKMCINQKDFFAENLARLLYEFEKQANKQLLTQAAMKLGCQADGTIGARKIPLYLPSTVSANPVRNTHLYADIQLQYENSDTPDVGYGIFGGSRLWYYMQEDPYASADMFGRDLSKQDTRNWKFMYEKDINTVLGQDQFFTIPYGAMQLVQWSQNVGDGAIDYPNFKKFRVFTPNGLSVDIEWRHNTDFGCNKIDMLLSSTFDLVSVPGGGCDLQDCVNGMFLFEDCSDGAVPPCPVP